MEGTADQRRVELRRRLMAAADCGLSDEMADRLVRLVVDAKLVPGPELIELAVDCAAIMRRFDLRLSSPRAFFLTTFHVWVRKFGIANGAEYAVGVERYVSLGDPTAQAGIPALPSDAAAVARRGAVAAARKVWSN